MVKNIDRWLIEGSKFKNLFPYFCREMPPEWDHFLMIYELFISQFLHLSGGTSLIFGVPNEVAE